MVSYSSFDPAFTRELERCGVKTEISHVGALELDGSARNQAMAQFKPDAVLSIMRRSAMMSITSQFGGVRTELASEAYDVTLTDVQSRKPVWKASVDFQPQFLGQDPPAETLAKQLVGRLMADGILKSCSAA